MSVSSVTSTDWTSILTSLSSSSSKTSSSSSSSSSKVDPEELWNSLSDALESGDLDAAKEAFETLKANKPEPPPGAQGMGQEQGEEGEDPFAALEEAIEAGDVESAQSILAEMEAKRPSGPPPGGMGAMDPSFNNDTTGAVGNTLNLLA